MASGRKEASTGEIGDERFPAGISGIAGTFLERVKVGEVVEPFLVGRLLVWGDTLVPKGHGESAREVP